MKFGFQTCFIDLDNKVQFSMESNLTRIHGLVFVSMIYIVQIGRSLQDSRQSKVHRVGVVVKAHNGPAEMESDIPLSPKVNAVKAFEDWLYGSSHCSSAIWRAGHSFGYWRA